VREVLAQMWFYCLINGIIGVVIGVIFANHCFICASFVFQGVNLLYLFIAQLLRFADHLTPINHITYIGLNLNFDLRADQFCSARLSLGNHVLETMYYTTNLLKLIGDNMSFLMDLFFKPTISKHLYYVNRRWICIFCLTLQLNKV